MKSRTLESVKVHHSIRTFQELSKKNSHFNRNNKIPRIYVSHYFVRVFNSAFVCLTLFVTSLVVQLFVLTDQEYRNKRKDDIHSIDVFAFLYRMCDAHSNECGGIRRSSSNSHYWYVLFFSYSSIVPRPFLTLYEAVRRNEN